MPTDDGCSSLGHLFGTVFEGILWGIYLILFFASLFLYRQRKGKVNRKHQCISIAMFWLFGVATAHFGVNLRYTQQGFSTTQVTADQYFSNTTHSLYVVDRALEGVAMLIGNGLLIYRVWDMIPNGHWLVAVLSILLLGSSSALFFLADKFATSGDLFAATIRHTSAVVFATALVLNIFVALLVLLRIHQAERLASSRDGMHRLTFLRLIVITTFESAILQPVYLVVLLALFYAKSENVEVVFIPIIQMIGIVPTIVWIQARLGLTRYDAAIEHYAFTVSRDMQFAAPDRNPPRPSHRPLECLFSHTDSSEDGQTKDELNSPEVSSADSFSIGPPKPAQCIPRGRPWQSPSVEQMRGPERIMHPSSDM